MGSFKVTIVGPYEDLELGGQRREGDVVGVTFLKVTSGLGNAAAVLPLSVELDR